MKEERLFKNTEEWKGELKGLNISSDSLKSAWDLFKRFRDEGYLKGHQK